MIKTKSIVPLLVGLGVGFYAVKLGVGMVKKAQAAGLGGAGVRIVTTTQQMTAGTQLTAEMLRLAEVPEVLKPSGAFTEPAKLVGRVTSMTLRMGGYLSEDVLAPPGTAPGLSVKIPRGYRAVAVKVDEYSSVAGFLKPGSRVDVIAVMTVRRDDRRDTVSRTILEDKLVAAVGQEMSDPKDPGANVTRSVTLLVKPQEAAVLHLADTKGVLRLALRQQEDSTMGGQGYASQNDMAGGDWESKPEKDPDSGWWQGLAEGLASRAASQAMRDAMAGEERPEPVRVAVAAPYSPWAVTVLNGSEMHTLVFESAYSARQIGQSDEDFGGLLNLGAQMGRYSDVLGRKKSRTDGPSVDLQWSAPQVN